MNDADDLKAVQSLAEIQGVPVYWVEDTCFLEPYEPCISISVKSEYFGRLPNIDATAARQEIKNRIFAALRAVEAIRDFSKYSDVGIEAVQALLENIK